MFTGKMVKGIFGRLTEQGRDGLPTFAGSWTFGDFCSHIGEQHEYDPVSGWVISRVNQDKVKLCSVDSFSFVQPKIVIDSTYKVCQTGSADYSEFLQELQTERV
jgi:hypothetical protein